MSSPSHLPVAARSAESAFLAALAAGLPYGFPSSFPRLVAVSGGADSVALLLGMARLAPAGLVVAHADHGLRPDSAADARFVAALAERLGLPCVTRRLTVAASGGREGLEGRARRLRYDFLTDAAHEVGARQVLVAHTADDQAETVLHRILRGTGLAGLGGMRRSRQLADGVALVRPLVLVRRAEVRAFLETVAQDWREDATNTDPARSRNFLRHAILAPSAAGPYPAATESLVRLASQAGAAADALASAAEHLLETHGRRGSNGRVTLNTAPMRRLHPHLVAEVFAAVWRREGWPRRDMTAAHYRSLADRVVCDAAGPFDLPGGVRVEFAADDLSLVRGDATGPVEPAG